MIEVDRRDAGAAVGLPGVEIGRPGIGEDELDRQPARCREPQRVRHARAGVAQPLGIDPAVREARRVAVKVVGRLHLQRDQTDAGAAAVQDEVTAPVDAAAEVDVIVLTSEFDHPDDVGVKVDRALKVVDR